MSSGTAGETTRNCWPPRKILGVAGEPECTCGDGGTTNRETRVHRPLRNCLTGRGSGREGREPTTQTPVSVVTSHSWRVENQLVITTTCPIRQGFLLDIQFDSCSVERSPPPSPHPASEFPVKIRLGLRIEDPTPRFGPPRFATGCRGLPGPPCRPRECTTLDTRLPHGRSRTRVNSSTETLNHWSTLSDIKT